MTTPEPEHALERALRGAPEQQLDIKDEEAFFAAGAPAKWSHGVEYCGEYETVFDGTNVAVRLNARALALAGIPVLLTSPLGRTIKDGIARPVYEVGLPEEVEREVGALRNTSMAQRAVRILHTVVPTESAASSMQALVLPRSVSVGVDPELVDGLLRRTVLFTVWERDRISHDVARVLDSVAEAWVPCEQNARMLRQCGVRNVVVIPHPFDPEGPYAKLVRRRPKPGKRFYAIGHWQPRKGFAKLVLAFLRAYGPEDDATLTIKTGALSWPGYPDPFLVLAEALRSNQVRARGWTQEAVDRKVKILNRQLHPSQIVQLHYENNIYVASSHGEAWCIPAYDAVVAGNRLVHVPFGGTADFAPFACIEDVRVPYVMGPVPESYGWEAGAQWAEYTVDDLVAALGRAKAPPEHSRSTEFDQRFSLKAVGELMRQRIEGLVLNDPEARAQFEQRVEVPIQGEVLPPEPPPERPSEQRRAPDAEPSRWQRVWNAARRIIRR